MGLEEIHQLNLHRIKLDNELKEKQLQIEAVTSKLNGLEEQIKEASDTVIEYNKQLKSKKALGQYYEKNPLTNFLLQAMKRLHYVMPLKRHLHALKGNMLLPKLEY